MNAKHHTNKNLSQKEGKSKLTRRMRGGTVSGLMIAFDGKLHLCNSRKEMKPFSTNVNEDSPNYPFS